MRFPLGKLLGAVVPFIPELVGKLLGRKSDPRPVIELPAQPARPGIQTSEYRNTRAVQIVAAVVAVVAVFAPTAPVEALQETLLWIAGLVAVIAQGGYAMSRAATKGELARAEAVQRAAEAAERIQAAGGRAPDMTAAARGVLRSSGMDAGLTRQQRRRIERERAPGGKGAR